jgi:hypothetical protein
MSACQNWSLEMAQGWRRPIMCRNGATSSRWNGWALCAACWHMQTMTLKVARTNRRALRIPMNPEARKA